MHVRVQMHRPAGLCGAAMSQSRGSPGPNRLFGASPQTLICIIGTTSVERVKEQPREGSGRVVKGWREEDNKWRWQEKRGEDGMKLKRRCGLKKESGL